MKLEFPVAGYEDFEAVDFDGSDHVAQTVFSPANHTIDRIVVWPNGLPADTTTTYIAVHLYKKHGDASPVSLWLATYRNGSALVSFPLMLPCACEKVVFDPNVNSKWGAICCFGWRTGSGGGS